MTFIGNRAKDGTSGHAVYATSLHQFQVIYNGTTNQSIFIHFSALEVFNIRGVTFDRNETLHPQIATDGALLHARLQTSP